MLELLPFWDHKLDDALIDYPMHWIGELDQHFVRSGREALNDQRLAARVGPAPGRVVDGHVDVADARRHIESARPENLRDPKVLGAALNCDQPAGERIRQRRIIFAGGSLAKGITPAGPRISLAVCATTSETDIAVAIAAREISTVVMRLLLKSIAQRPRSGRAPV